MDLSMIAYCGVDCAVCTDYKTNKCPGCRKSVWPDGNPCMPVACCERRGISLCGQCAEFPCAEMKAFYEESESHKKAYRLMCEIRSGEQELRESV